MFHGFVDVSESSTLWCPLNELHAVPVHSGSGSAPRAATLEQLEAGQLEIVCSVDLFNEGVDRSKRYQWYQ
jgi:hypothetical protein